MTTICEKHDCVKCCLHASVPLLNEDLNRIIYLGYYDVYFVVEEDGVKTMRTKNDGSCIFYNEDEGNCKIGANRPEQCKQRPYTIRNDSHEPGIDDECIHHHECELDQTSVKKMASYFDTLKKEIEWRRRTGYF